ncbi:MAG: hypothetical protein J6B50_11315 [Lachnospiraceae bacterium]|nr:hypothetical protein [Lachnospiraceae bacterium]MBP3595256.1 hypothetical protein [Lachnospiraceae bacterium]
MNRMIAVLSEHDAHDQMNSKNKMTQKEIIVLCCLIVLSLEYVLHYYIDLGILPKMLIYVNTFAAVIMPVYSFFVKRKNLKFSAYSTVLLCYFIAMLGYTVVLMKYSGRMSRDVVCITIYLQILSAILLQDLKLEYLNRFFKILGCLSIIGFIYCFFSFNIDIEVAINRGYQYEEIFYYAALFWSAVPFVLIAFIKKKNYFLPIACLALEVIINLIIVKRMILVQVLVLSIVLIVALVLDKRAKGKGKNIIKIVCAIGIALLLMRCFMWDTIVKLFESILERTKDVTENLSNFNRFVESKNYYKDATLLQIIFGKGFGGTHKGLGTVSEALHVGWANLGLKGGLILIALVIIPYVKMLVIAGKYRNFPDEIKFSFLYLLYMGPMLFLINMHSFNPQMFLFFYCCIKIMNYRYSALNNL